MNIRVQPGKIGGVVQIPASKSAAHRALICAAFALGESKISGITMNNDIAATINCLKNIGVVIEDCGDYLSVTGAKNIPERADFYCGESGSTLRFMIPIAAALGIEARFFGEAELPNRPNTPLTDVLAANGVTIGKSDGAILTISGKLRSGVYELAGNISSQYITGLLYAMALLEGDSAIRLSTALLSGGYVDMTLSAMRDFGVAVERTADGFAISGLRAFTAANYAVEGDYSSAAFWLCAAALTGEITVTGLRQDSVQGDKAVIDILREMGANIGFDGDGLHCKRAALRAVDINAEQIPDLVPVLAVCCALADGTSTISGAGRLRIKECDRLRAVTQELGRMGADIEERAEGLVITGKQNLLGDCTVDSWNDHRIPMSMSVAALCCCAPVTVTGAQCVAKSYPRFYDDFKALGGVFDVLDMG